MSKQEGITVKKEQDFSEWYQQLILKSELADYTQVSGCIVFRPRSYQVWEKVQKVIDLEFKKIGIQNSYFPLFIPESLLSREQEHVKGFTPEVAWVTQSGEEKLNERLAVRPTSEAIMYDSYSKWIRSYRDLPLKLNQWNNVVRWEFKNPVPFLRTREFLWNEGHNVYSNEKDLDKDRDIILKIYSDFLKDYMALPGLIGRKTDREKFAGAKATYSIEIIIPNGKAIQGPDFHDDGNNFAKAYNIKYLDEKEKEQYVLQATYAITTRMLGVMFAIHSDNKGLVLPPKLAENKLVIVPIIFEDSKAKVFKEAEKIKKELGIYNPILDDREGYSPGWKFSEWELKGIPLRLEIGPKDLKAKQVVLVTRLGKKLNIKISELSKKIPKILEEMHEELYKNAEKLMKNSIVETNNLNELIKVIENKKIALTQLCKSEECEEWIKSKTNGAKTLNIPFKQKTNLGKCVYCGKKADYSVYIGKSY
ncbi:MAG: proline--tRNA ligase [Candidatus Nanoarchaeia archaeon]|nr:proline--tRNA ligase [Candidatus Nanoarchaeia archaeon]MDD5587998.1 proline--tRNA ligase [Candidatus Nanoarchaeia archaeon]